MFSLKTNNMNININFETAKITSIKILNIERLYKQSPLFKLSFLDEKGQRTQLTSDEFVFLNFSNNIATYTANNYPDLTVKVLLVTNDNDIEWRIAVSNVKSNLVCEWITFPQITLPPLKENNLANNGGVILYPYNEGAIYSDMMQRENSNQRYREPKYPSEGNYGIFPNMVFAQFIAYHFDDCGIYFGMHDKARAVKGINFAPNDDGVAIDIRLYTNCNFGEDFIMDYPIVIAKTESNWESSAEKYRRFFENNLPNGVCKISENKNLPAWYKNSPLVVSYPIRGAHDMDTTPNDFFPYTNAIPVIDEIKQKTNSQILVLLMHWEGTAPWAPPYVWPPYGGVENFYEFKNYLNKNNDLLGVYCSGFGYTIQSNLIPEYNKSEEYDKKCLSKAMCSSETGEITSVICQGQRKSYDVCPASPVGKHLLNDAYQPLFESGLDYVQILDQNHGGGQYFCYSKEHGHPPVPGKWMTESMQELLTDWNKKAPNTLFGCESAGAEPYIGNLLFSDNRFELNYAGGMPVSLYSYIFHEYVRNFMGNQVGCPINGFEDSVNYRLAYSFVAGDSMTIVLSPDKSILPNWGFRYNDNANNRELTFKFINNLTSFYKNDKYKLLYNGRRIPAKEVICDTISYSMWHTNKPLVVPKILTCAYEIDGKKIQILCNPFNYEVPCKLNGNNYIIEPLNAIKVQI